MATNKEIASHFLGGNWNFDRLDSLNDFIAKDHVFHGPMGDIRGREAYKDLIEEELEAISRLVVRIDDAIEEGDKVVVRHTSWFEHRGELMGAFPDGGTHTVPAISILRLADGKICETWEPYDRRSVLREVAAEQHLSEESAAAIRSIVDEAVAIGFAKRRELAQLYYADTAQVIAANGAVFHGILSITEWLERFPPVAEWRLTVTEIDGAGELAYVRGKYTIVLSERARLPFDEGHYLEIWRVQPNGRWKVVRNVYTSEIATRSKKLVHA